MAITLDGTTGITTPGVVNTAAETIATTLAVTGVTTLQAGTAALPALTTSGDTNTGIFFPAADTIAFSEGGTESMRIDSSGNLGIGVTPSAWRSAFNVTYGERALELTYSALVTQAGPSTILANNVYFNSSNQWIYKNAVANTNAGLYTIGSDGLHTWSVAPTGASGAVATFTQVLSINKDKSLALQGATAATGAGITFPASQSASSDPQTLDDYEEGTWTPTVTFGGASVGITYNTTFTGATYTKIGNRVCISGFLLLTNKGSSTGSARIANLPFTSESGNTKYLGATVGGSAFTFANQFWAFIDPNTNLINIHESTEAGASSSLTNSDLTNGTEFYFSATYTV